MSKKFIKINGRRFLFVTRDDAIDSIAAHHADVFKRDYALVRAGIERTYKDIELVREYHKIHCLPGDVTVRVSTRPLGVKIPERMDQILCPVARPYNSSLAI